MNKKKLILIAEDDVSIKTVLSTELENKYELKLTDNCAQLWNWVSDGLGDLIILDVVMPDENGLDLIPKIKEIRKDINTARATNGSLSNREHQNNKIGKAGRNRW